MKNKNKWLLTSNTHKGIKHVKPCSHLMGKDQFVLFMNGHQQKGVNDYEGLANLVESLADCVQCYQPTTCEYCLAFDNIDIEEGIIYFSFDYSNILYFSGAFYATSTFIPLTDGFISVDEQDLEMGFYDMFSNNKLNHIIVQGTTSTNEIGTCIVNDYPVRANGYISGVTEFNIETVLDEISINCSTEYIIDLIYGPDGLTWEYNDETNIITLLNDTTTVDNKFIFGIYCEECLVGFFTAQTEE